MCVLSDFVQFINQSADLVASSRVDLRARPEFSTLPPSTSYTPAVAHFTAPKVISVDASDLRLPSAERLDTRSVASKSTADVKASTRHLFPPGHDQYGCVTLFTIATLKRSELIPGDDAVVFFLLFCYSAKLTSQGVTFGHRPSVRSTDQTTH
jgi:hypothetical protein